MKKCPMTKLENPGTQSLIRMPKVHSNPQGYRIWIRSLVPNVTKALNFKSTNHLTSILKVQPLSPKKEETHIKTQGHHRRMSSLKLAGKGTGKDIAHIQGFNSQIGEQRQHHKQLSQTKILQPPTSITKTSSKFTHRQVQQYFNATKQPNRLSIETLSEISKSDCNEYEVWDNTKLRRFGVDLEKMDRLTHTERYKIRFGSFPTQEERIDNFKVVQSVKNIAKCNPDLLQKYFKKYQDYDFQDNIDYSRFQKESFKTIRFQFPPIAETN